MEILSENAEYTSRKKAEQYLLNLGVMSDSVINNEFGNGIEDEKQAIDYFLRIYIRNKIPSLHSSKGGKYLFGCVRIIFDEGIPAKEYKNLNNIIKAILKDEELYKSINYNFNDYELDILKKKMYDYLYRFGEDEDDKEVKEVKQESPKNELYTVKLIDSYETSEKYMDYVDWCVCHDYELYKSYRADGERTMYFLIRYDFDDFDQPDDDVDLEEVDARDSYGTSMICVIVDEKGKLTDSVTRYNHKITPPSGDVQMAFTKEEIEDIIQTKFENVFIPHPEMLETQQENFYKKNKNMLDNLMDWFTEEYFNENFKQNSNYYIDDTYTDDYLIRFRVSTNNHKIYDIEITVFDEHKDDSHLYQSAYDFENKKFITDWVTNVWNVGNCIITTELNEKDNYVININDNKKINKYPYKYTQRYNNVIAAYNQNDSLRLINSINGEVYIPKTHLSTIKSPFELDIQRNALLLTNDSQKDINKFIAFNGKEFKPYEDEILYTNNFGRGSGIYTISDNETQLAYTIFSTDSEFKNNYLINFLKYEKIKVPLFGKSTLCRNGYAVFTNKELNKSFVFSFESKNVIDTIKSANLLYYFFDSDLPRNTAILPYKDENDDVYTKFYKNDEDLLKDNTITKVEVIYKKDYSKLYKIYDEKLKKYAIITSNIELYDIDGKSWFDDITETNDSLVFKNDGNKKPYVMNTDEIV